MNLLCGAMRTMLRPVFPILRGSDNPVVVEFPGKSCIGARIEKAPGDAVVSINAAVTQKRPVLTGGIGFSEVNLENGDIVAVMRRLMDQLAQGVDGKRAAPKDDITFFSNPVD